MDCDNTVVSRGGANEETLPPGLTVEEAEELQLELSKVEDEIQTLRQVLTAKERHAGDLKRRLGLTPLTEFKQTISKGWQEVQTSNAYMRTSETLGDLNNRVTSSNFYLTASATLDDISRSDAYKRTQETFSQAGQMTSAAISSMGTAIRSRFGDMRNSTTFKSFEDKFENMKYKVGGSRVNGDSGLSPTSPVQDNAPF